MGNATVFYLYIFNTKYEWISYLDLKRFKTYFVTKHHAAKKHIQSG